MLALKRLRRPVGRIDRRLEPLRIVDPRRRPVAGQPVVERAAHDTEEPGATIVASDRIDVPHRPHTGVLHHVFGVARVVGQPAREVEGGVQMDHHALFEIGVRGHGILLHWSDRRGAGFIPARE